VKAFVGGRGVTWQGAGHVPTGEYATPGDEHGVRRLDAGSNKAKAWVGLITQV